jgi:hypothetical protein
MRGEEMGYVYNILVTKHEERDYMEDLRIGWRIILK